MATALAKLPKAQQKIARSAIGERTSKLRKRFAEERMINTGLAFAASAGAAFVDDKFRKGIESEAKFGDPPAPGEEGGFRPPVNAVVGLAAVAVGLMGPKRYSGPALAIGVGFGGPAVYAFTRNQLAR